MASLYGVDGEVSEQWSDHDDDSVQEKTSDEKRRSWRGYDIPRSATSSGTGTPAIETNKSSPEKMRRVKTDGYRSKVR